MDIKTFLKKTDRSKKIAVCALVVFTAGALGMSAYSNYRTEKALAEEAAAWEAELSAMAAEQAAAQGAAAEPRLIELLSVTGNGEPLLATSYLPTKVAGETFSMELSAEIRSLGPGSELSEGTEIILTLPEDKPASVMIWRDPIGEQTPAESVNYTREETESGIRCVFTVAYSGYDALDYAFDVKIDEHNQGKIGFTAIRPQDAEVQEMTNG